MKRLTKLEADWYGGSIEWTANCARERKECECGVKTDGRLTLFSPPQHRINVAMCQECTLKLLSLKLQQ